MDTELFSPESHKSNSSPVFSLDDFVDKHVWTAWRSEVRNGKTTKVPYQASGVHAKSNDPTTWTTPEKAAATAQLIGGQLGIFLGIDCGGGYLLGGCDLDTCRDATTGGIVPWAQAVIDRFASYSEISPSQTGIKVMFAYREADLVELRGILGGKDGKAIKKAARSDHPPGIEVYLGVRYFAVTCDALPSLDVIRPIEVDDLRWLIEHGTAQFPRRATPNGHVETYNGVGNGAFDQSRSGVAYRRAATLRGSGIDNYPAFRDAMLEDPTTADWTMEKGLVNHERELHRLFDRVKFNRFVADQTADYRRQMEEETTSEMDAAAEEPKPSTIETSAVIERTRKRLFFDEYETRPEIDYWDRETKLLARVPGGHVVLICGLRGSHKTGTAISMVLDAVLGAGARALYVACEGQYFFGRARMPAYCRDRGIETRDLRERFEFWPDGINLNDPKQVAEFIRENQDFRPDIIVIDTLAQATPGIDSNTSFKGDIFGHAGPVAAFRRAWDCLVIVNCHPPKNNPRDILGHTSIVGNTDMVLILEYDRECGIITMTVERNKDGPEGGELYFQVDPEGLPVPKRISADALPDKPLGLQPRNFDLDEAMLVRHVLAENDLIDFDAGIGNRQLAELIVPKGDLPEMIASWPDRVRDKTKHLANVQQKKVLPGKGSPYDDLTGRGAPFGKTKPERRWWDMGGRPVVAEKGLTD
jgi:hypothetical protein